MSGFQPAPIRVPPTVLDLHRRAGNTSASPVKSVARFQANVGLHIGNEESLPVPPGNYLPGNKGPSVTTTTSAANQDIKNENESAAPSLFTSLRNYFGGGSSEDGSPKMENHWRDSPVDDVAPSGLQAGATNQNRLNHLDPPDKHSSSSGGHNSSSGAAQPIKSERSDVRNFVQATGPPSSVVMVPQGIEPASAGTLSTSSQSPVKLGILYV